MQQQPNKDLLIEAASDLEKTHEGRPDGVPDNIDWSSEPRINAGNDPGGFEAVNAWGQIYEDAAGNPAENTRVKLRNIQTYVFSKKEGEWNLVQSSPTVEGAAYKLDFANDTNQPADIRTEPDGSLSIKVTPGFNFHFWPTGGRGTIDPNDVGGVYTTVDAKLILDDPNKPDDRAQAKYLMGMGSDYWKDATAGWDNFKTNYDAVVGRFRYVDSEWDSFGATSFTEEAIEEDPRLVEGLPSSQVSEGDTVGDSGSPTHQPDQSEPTGLVASLNFEDIPGGIAADSSPIKNNPATLIGEIATTKGAKGNAIALNGKGQYAEIANTSDINLGVHNQRTISLWFKVNNASVDSRKQVIYEEGAGTRGLNVYVHDDQLRVGGWNEPTGESGWEGTWLSTDNISSNQWHHIALVLDGSDNLGSKAITGYLDGETFGYGEGSQLWERPGAIGLGSINGGTKFHDGSEPGNGHGLAGAIDEVKIFNDALTAGQIQSLAA
ncbi:MAG: LamG domain-containing protein [Cyanobacteria bacterium J06626_18]